MSEELCKAAEDGNFGEVQRLLNEGAEINCLVGGLTPLYRACLKGRFEIAEFLIMRGADVSLGYTTPLMGASSDNAIPIINLLLRHKAEINKEGNMGFTALHFAVSLKSFGATKLLLENNADYEIGSAPGQGWAPLKMAEANGCQEIAKLIKEKMVSDGKTLPGIHARIRR